MSVLVANRGEIAVRVVRAAQEAGLPAVVAVTRDEQDSLAARLAGAVHVLPGEGPGAYLDAAALVAAAREHGCTMLHPGYGFLSEHPDLARACEEAGVTFVGPASHLLALFGDKGAARRAAQEVGVPVLPATPVGIGQDEAVAFAAELGECEVETEMKKSYRCYRFKQDDLPVRLAVDGLRRSGREPSFALSGGAADANVFNERGLQCVNLANGMANIHTPDEQITVDDLEGMIDVTLALVDAARDAA